MTAVNGDPLLPHTARFVMAMNELPPPPCISYANVHNYYGPYAYCSLDKGVACAQHIQLPTHTRAQATCAEIGNSRPMGCIRLKKKFLVHQQGATCAEIGKCDDKPMSYVAYISYVIKLRTQLLRSLRLL